MTTVDFALRCAEKMARTIPFFPNSDDFLADIAEFMCAMCNSDEEIRWLLNAAINTFPDWGKTGSIASMRALFCSQFTPADGIPASVDAPAAFSRSSRETLRIDRDTDEFERKLAQWKAEKLLETGSPEGVFTEQPLIAASAESIGIDNPRSPAKPKPLKVPEVHVSIEETRQAEAELATHPTYPTRSAEESEYLVQQLRDSLRGRGLDV